ncbi:MAG: ThiS family protein [Candidatus Bathyarchaeota archaeon BA1]|nr:MAG: ThiS family protein [Candidatus Bathyarchaeota archaeon BA1]
MTAYVKVLLHAAFREIAGEREILEEVGSGSTLKDILGRLGKRYGKDFNEIIDSETGEISSEVLVMVNGKSVRRTDIELRDKDTLMITVPVGGG